MGSAPSGSTATLKALRNPAASKAWFHHMAPSMSAAFTSSGAPESTQYSMGFTGSLMAAVGSFFCRRWRRMKRNWMDSATGTLKSTKVMPP